VSGHEPLATRLDEERDHVLRLWEERARRTIPAASRPDRLMLLDGLPGVLEELVGELSHGPPYTMTKRESENASSHGRQRANVTEYSLDQVIAEYELLRHVLFDVLEAPDAPLIGEEREAILAGIENRVRAAASEFARVREAERERDREELRQAKETLEQKVRERTAELTQSEQMFRGLVEGVKDYAIFAVNQQGFITSWNDGAERMKGYTVAEAVGRHFEMLYPHEARVRDEPMAHLRAAAIEGRFRGEGMRVRKNGDYYLADVLITPMYDGDKLTGFSKVVQDLTERNTLIQEQDLLRSDADRLRVEAEYRERFVATLTHDLRSPIAAAKMAAALIEKAPEKQDNVTKLAKRIGHSIDRADRMIADMLDASRIDAGHGLVLEFDRCDLRTIAQDVCAHLSARHGDRFKLDIDGDTRGCWNADGLWRVLENFLSNAVKYGDPNTSITIGLRRREERLLMAVHNFGTIIPIAEQAKLFHPFHRTNAATVSGKPGWGLGLTLVRGIAEAHKAHVKVESYPKEGTTFTVDLPVDSRS
jgi:PAS domain S-box-containing protein